jgi:Leucine-rich repeat (LRR) protein
LTQMTRLAINNNDLSGEIPSELRVLTNLSELSLGNNALSGRIT